MAPLVETLIERLGLTDCFHFSSVGLGNKGDRIARILELYRFSAKHALFIDDMAVNLEVAQQRNPGLGTVQAPGDARDLIAKFAEALKAMAPSNRNETYAGIEKRILAQEKYISESAAAAADKNAADLRAELEFLEKSMLKVELVHMADNNYFHFSDRIGELLSRANQLNFTKQRLTSDEFNDHFRTYQGDSFCVFVSDCYADYGLVGFCEKSKREEKLLHFTFSCRILGLRIEKVLYKYFGEPAIDIVPPISTSLEALADSLPSTCTVVHVGAKSKLTPAKPKHPMIVVGGCEVARIAHLLSVNVWANLLPPATPQWLKFSAKNRFSHFVNMAQNYRFARAGVFEDNKLYYDPSLLAPMSTLIMETFTIEIAHYYELTDPLAGVEKMKTGLLPNL